MLIMNTFCYFEVLLLFSSCSIYFRSHVSSITSTLVHVHGDLARLFIPTKFQIGIVSTSTEISMFLKDLLRGCKYFWNLGE